MSVRVRILDILVFINFMITHYFERKRRTQKGKVKSKIPKEINIKWCYRYRAGIWLNIWRDNREHLLIRYHRSHHLMMMIYWLVLEVPPHQNDHHLSYNEYAMSLVTAPWQRRMLGHAKTGSNAMLTFSPIVVNRQHQNIRIDDSIRVRHRAKKLYPHCSPLVTLEERWLWVY